MHNDGPEICDDDLLDLLYSAAVDPVVWTEFLALLARRADATALALLWHDPANLQYAVGAKFGFPDDAQRLYEQYYGALDPWYLSGKDSLVAGVVELGSALCPPSALENTEYYNDYLRPYPCFYQSGVIIENRGESRAVLTLLRAKQQADFDPSHLQFLTNLYPHLRRALQVHRKMVDLKLAASAAAGVIDALDVALIGLDARGKVCLMNRQAEELIRSGEVLNIRNGKITAVDPMATADLDRLLRTAFIRGLGESPGGEIELRSGTRSVYLSVFPFTVDSHLVLRSGVLLTITDPATRPHSRSRSLSALFGLTASEIRVAMMLVAGLETREIANRVGVSYDTVRFQLKSIYQKMGVARQSQLVRLISRLPGRA
jgi:DNA-binding CsgD family transcriptional regulator/PAS domain-containing protein